MTDIFPQAHADGYQPPWLPPSQGFDLFHGLASGDGDYHTHVDRSGNEDWWHNNRIEPDVTSATTHSIDLLPTLAKLAGTEEDLEVDGIDLAPVLFRDESLPERTLFLRAGSQRAVRRGPWKLCVTAAGKPAELYNLEDDLGEQHDLAAEKPELTKQLGEAWTQWEADVKRNVKPHDRQCSLNLKETVP